ncbi:MAG: glycosyltransferase [Cytophagales bacterium]|nr:MAG: glycosyltransferase [Cytophagales bacterium]
MDQTNFISVIIPTYHRNDLLALCLDQLSPMIQHIPSDCYEVIVSDDGTKQTAQQLIKEKYPWAKWVEGPRKGPAANRNNGAKYAKGNWLLFTDDDCLPEPNWLNAYYEAIKEHSEIKVFEGKTVCKLGIKSPLETAPINETGGLLWSCNFAIKRTIFERLQGFNTSFPFAHMEDVEFRERLKDNNIEFQFSKDAVIDHPPRAINSGFFLAKYHESEFYYYVVLKKDKVFPFATKLIKNIIRFRLESILHNKFSTLSFIAFYNFCIELPLTFFYLFQWVKKYKF